MGLSPLQQKASLIKLKVELKILFPLSKKFLYSRTDEKKSPPPSDTGYLTSKICHNRAKIGGISKKKVDFKI